MKQNSEIELRGRLSGQQKTRLINLLNMMYRPSEIAEEIGFEKRQMYKVYIPLGLPHEKDINNRIWINGIIFRDWIKELYKKIPMNKNEAFCVTCRQPVEIINPEWKEKEGLFYLLCDCPECGNKAAKITDRKV